MASLKVLSDYGPAFQVKTIGALLTRKEFVQNIYDILSDEHFPNLLISGLSMKFYNIGISTIQLSQWIPSR